MEVMAVILLAFTFSYVLGEALRRINLPKVLAPVFAGFIMTTPLIEPYLDLQGIMPVLTAFANLGLVFIMFFVGLEIDMGAFRSCMKRSVHVAFFNAAVPFVIGYISFRWMGYSPLVSLIVGAALSITAEAISIDILQELGILRTKLGSVIVEAGILDDILEILLVAGIIAYINGSGRNAAQGLLLILFQVFSFLLLAYVVRWFIVPKAFETLKEKESSKTDVFVTFLILTLLMAVSSSFLGMGSVIGALAAGMIVRHSFFSGNAQEQEELERNKGIMEVIEIITFGLLAPFFFLWIGMNVSYESLTSNPMLGIIVTGIALAGKLAGSVIGNWLSEGTLAEGITIGWGMNSRGAVELIAAKIAFENGLIGNDIFSALVFMSFTTTLISPVFFKMSIERYHIKRRSPFRRIVTLFRESSRIFEKKGAVQPEIQQSGSK
ncbi:cation:proton antiporter [Candidatus Woesearchaeota archaeon]|nr:MAG: cation:proton antiporter [Candidatus Woesearchaeota archaeon]